MPEQEDAGKAALPGRLVVVVGPSGVGKDSLLSAARATLATVPDLLFVRRAITRPASGDAEDHEPMSDEAFAAAEQDGAFCFTWRAHGLCYGLRTDLEAHLGAERPAIVNGSRKVLADMARRFPGLAIVRVTADPQVIAARLASRGRESDEEIAARLARAAEIPDVAPVAVVDNSGTLDDAARSFVDAVTEFLR